MKLILINTGGNGTDAFITDGKAGEPNVTQSEKVGGKEETRRFLENLGFVVGGTRDSRYPRSDGNHHRECERIPRVAIGKDMANKIMV